MTGRVGISGSLRLGRDVAMVANGPEEGAWRVFPREREATRVKGVELESSSVNVLFATVAVGAIVKVAVAVERTEVGAGVVPEGAALRGWRCGGPLAATTGGASLSDCIGEAIGKVFAERLQKDS